jgi:urease accessory protein
VTVAVDRRAMASRCGAARRLADRAPAGRRRLAHRLASGVPAIGLVLAATRPAHAHLLSTGVGPFYDGAAHFFVSIEELLPVLALALLAGLRGPRSGRWAIVVLPLAWLAGGLLGLHAPLQAPPAAPTMLLLVPGVLVASDRALPLPVVLGVTASVGLGSGFTNGAAMAAAGAGLLAVAGAAAAAFVVATLGAAVAARQRDGWTRIAVRVAGSWIAALGLLALGWAFRR